MRSSATRAPSWLTTSLSHTMNAPRPTRVSRGTHEISVRPRIVRRSPTTAGSKYSISMSVANAAVVSGTGGSGIAPARVRGMSTWGWACG